MHNSPSDITKHIITVNDKEKNMKIPIMNLGVQYDQLKGEIDNTMAEIASSSRFILGRETEQFEKEICEYCGVNYAVGVGSGTEALILALTALSVTPPISLPSPNGWSPPSSWAATGP